MQPGKLRFQTPGFSEGAAAERVGNTMKLDNLTVHRELKRKHVASLFVWDEYIAETPSGYSYPRFWELYRAFESKLSPTMRQTHGAGERLFVDYAGDGVPVVDRLTPALPEYPLSSLETAALPCLVFWQGQKLL